MNCEPLKKESILCLMFFVSGFCSLLYQTIWLRLAFAKFGVITPVVSVLVSVFMLGLGLGSLCAGVYIARLKGLLGCSAIRLYGLTECFIGLGAFIVPGLFNIGSNFCSVTGESDSWLYLFSSAVIITVSILPFAFAMGATFPLALEFLQENIQKNPKTFGLLYIVNTAGAWLGTIVTVFVLIEILGFSRTLLIAAFFNFTVGLTAFFWSSKCEPLTNQYGLVKNSAQGAPVQWPINTFRLLLVLFTTGFCFMAMEVVWTRSFTPVLGNLVYSFATLLASYLACNWFGASIYRIHLKNNRVISLTILLAWTAFAATLPLLSSNPVFVQFLTGGQCISSDTGAAASLILLSIMPFSTLLGYLTPLVIDDLSRGSPLLAGKAYAINITGCVLGPLIAGYLLLPYFGARFSLIFLVLPLIAISLITHQEKKNAFALLSRASAIFLSTAILLSAFCWLSWDEGGFLEPEKHTLTIYRDYAATTIACKTKGLSLLLVNGQGMTCLTPLTKFMVHLPAAFLKTKPKSILVICFGMGTSFRSALTWDCKVTAVELVPGVIKAFGCYYPDATTLLKNNNVQVVIDDGRRFLQRTNEKFDVIIVDPPPPLEAAGSSLLCSREFFNLVKRHLNPEGILQEWSYPDETVYTRAMLRGLKQEFSNVRIYKALYDPRLVGFHCLASNSPIPRLTAEEFYAKLPARVKDDLKEPIDILKFDLNQEIAQIFANEVQVDKLLAIKEKAIVITDDYPYNEYYLLQTIFKKQVCLAQ
jgi:spermidine synthase